jgi:hypothetical protein
VVPARKHRLNKVKDYTMGLFAILKAKAEKRAIQDENQDQFDR